MGLIDEYIAETASEFVDWTPIKGKDVLITGASGFLGRHILRAIETHGDARNIYAQCYQQQPPNDSKAHWIQANLALDEDCERIPSVDVVIHAASYATPDRFLSAPILALWGAAHGTLAMLERVKVGGRFMYFSSSEVYANCGASPPYSEDIVGSISPYNPRAVYTQAKLFCEALTYAHRVRNISTVAVRPGITYGPGTQPGDKRAWSQFIEAAAAGCEIVLRDAGTVERTYCYITDGLEMMLNILTRGKREVYNIAGIHHVSVGDFARACAVAGKTRAIIPDNVDEKAPPNLRVDCSRYMGEFYKRAWTPLSEGIKQTIEWRRENA